MATSVEQIKEKLSITDVISSYLKIEKAGGNFKARCPFHNEKTPSFFISPTRNTFYCFGCGEKGDIFTFVERFEGLDFQGALRVLGDRAGVQIVFESKEKKDKRDVLYAILEETTKFFESKLESSKDAQKYVKDRGLEKKSIEQFRIGYISVGWNALRDHLVERGYTETDIERAGLIKKGDKGYYDRFRGRVIFPIADSSGRIIAFSGRMFPDEEGGAKYLNSPETELFNKSKVLYGYDKAKLAIRKSNFSIVVEGQMDIVLSHQIGFTNTVALSGTALTADHVRLLDRLSKNVVLAFDADKAGIASAGRSAEIALSFGMDVKVAHMPNGVDPADLANKGAEDLKKVIRESEHIIDFYMSILSEANSDQRAFGKEVERVVLPFISRISSKIDQSYFISRVAGRLGIDKDILTGEIAKIPVDQNANQAAQSATPKVENVEPVRKSRRDVIEDKLFGILLWQDSVDDKSISSDDLKNKIIEIIGKEKFEEKNKHQEDFKEDILFLAEVGYSNSKLMLNDVGELLTALGEECAKEQFGLALIELRKAEHMGDDAAIEKQLQVCKEVSEKINNFNVEKEAGQI